MRTPDSAYVTALLAATESPCVSVYLPTQRLNGGGIGGLAGQQNHARFRGLVDRAAETLAKSGHGSKALAQRLQELGNDEQFWGRVLDGVAALASPQRLDAFTLPRPVPEHVSVGESFHVKPLLRFVQSADPFHVLGVSRERVALFQGNRYELHPLTVPGLPLTLNESLGTRSSTPTPGLHAAEPASTIRPNAKAGGEESHGHLVGQGHATRKIDGHPDAERFYQEVDREVIRRVSEPSGLPLILAGIDENLAEFRTVSKNRFLAAEGVHGDWTKWTLPEIREKAWKVFEKHYLDRLAKFREDYGTAAAHGKGTADLTEAAKAAAVGRVGILLIDDDRTVPGHIDSGGKLHPDGNSRVAGDMLDDLAELALRTKATVIVTPATQMPTKTGLAAIYRY
jgi:hypothetical protein